MLSLHKVLVSTTVKLSSVEESSLAVLQDATAP